jgi:hypothetical protein
MTTNKRAETIRLRQIEYRQSRIKMAKEFALINTTAELLNNYKWYSIFDRLDDMKSIFELKTLLSNDIKVCHHIQEL